MNRFPHAIACLLFLVSVSGVNPVSADDRQAEFFETKIRPVLVDKCYSCHSAEKKQRGGLTLDSKAAVLAGGDTGPSVIPGKPGDSLLIKALKHASPDLKMPPDGKLPPQVIADFERWIADGAFDPRDGGVEKSKGIDLAKGREFWSFQPPTRPNLPAVKNPSWVKTPIDRFILAKLETEGLKPAKTADRRELIRRATFDLIGLPPTPAEVEAFQNDTSSDAYAKVIDRLLNSPHYGERWGRHWLDVARYAEDQAHTFGVKPNLNAYRYRDWVIAALNADMPYDRFVKLQIAADLVDLSDAERVEHLPALGFFGLGAQYYKNSDAAKASADELDDRVDTLTRGFLGLTVSCARCHDHKFDPIPQVDYYSLAGIFQSSRLTEVLLAPPAEVKRYTEGQNKLKKVEQDQKTFAKNEKEAIAIASIGDIARSMTSAWRFQVENRGPKKMGMKEFATRENLTADVLGRWVKFLKNGPKSPVLDACRAMFETTEPKMLDQVEAAARDIQTKLQDALAAKSSKSMSKDQSELLKIFLNAKGPLEPTDEELPSLLTGDKKTTYDQFTAAMTAIKSEYPQTKLPAAHGLTEGSPQDMKVFLRGNPAKPGDVAPRRFLQVLSNSDAKFSKGSGRLELADAIADPANPLTARVMVNRIWQRHFGRGLVGTPSNFGELGDRPTHPELLDYLAQRLVDQNWSLKAIHREIALSATYQASCEELPENVAKDAGNRWWWRRDRGRLDVESWRDAMLSVAGKLDLAIGGPTFDLNNTAVTRRTVYAKISRHDLNATLRLFDFPDANITSEKRTETTVPQQQLFALNSGFVVETAKAFAARLQSADKDDNVRVRQGFLLAFGREPSEDERSAAVAFLQETDPPETKTAIRLTRWERLAQVLLASNEFAYID